MDKLKMHSVNKVDENVAKIGKLFPNCLTERKNENGEVEYAIDFDVLKQELSSVVVEGNEERYQFTWPDKKKSILLANAPIAKTLRPCREESVDFDTTENLYIEGDNLDVLKLLQETYLGKIKMIYIDPPYNTGNDFVYNDNFAKDADTYLANSGQFDDEGNRLLQNTESNGRHHTDWLNMIYPRLKLSRDLLADNGVIFISIDDHEFANLCRVCDEVFGANNCIGVFTWISKTGGGSDNGFVVNDQEYVLCYAKNINSSQGIVNKIKIDAEELDREDEWGKYRLGRELNKWGSNSRREDRPTMFFPIPGPNGEDVYPIRNDGTEGCWRWGKTAMFDAIANNNCEFVARGDGTYIVYEKVRTKTERYKPYRTFISDTGSTADGSKGVKSLFAEKKVFDFPKPINLMRYLLQVASDSKESMVLDFFSGSATTAHAVMQLNAEDGGNRKFIMVQLPEETDVKSEAYKAGYKNICEIGKERIRRAGAEIKRTAGKIKIENTQRELEYTEKPAKYVFNDVYVTEPSVTLEQYKTEDLDVGFRVLKLDSTNMKDVYYSPADYEMSMFETLADNIKEDRTPEDLLFQVMLDLGILLSSKIEESTIAGKKVFYVDNGSLCACFDENINEETITAIAKKKPDYFVMRDSSMASDSVATNFDQIFATYSPDTVRKVL